MIALNFHGIGQPHAGVPEDEKPYWLSHDQFRELLDLVWDRYDPRRFVFTFDDGNRSDLQAAEWLQERGATGRFFLLTGRFDDREYCSREDARQLDAMGMTVGLHGRDHVDWRHCDDRRLAEETEGARGALSDALGKPVEEVAIPFGAYNRRVIAALESQGFARIHTSDCGTFDPSAPIWNRNTFRSDMSEEEIGSILAGNWPLPVRLRRALSRFARRNML